MSDIAHSGPALAWVVLDPATVPEALRSRARTVALVTLLPSELAVLLGPRAWDSIIAPEDAELLGLVAAGHPGSYIARRLGISDRSVFRRLARWRERFGVSSTAELAAELSKRGF